MQQLETSWECLWIDDGSEDETPELLKRLSDSDLHHRFISFSRNYGQSAAFTSGFSNARGRVFITMDGDGQNDPAEIPRLLETLRTQKCDMVQGWREKRDDNFIRKISSKIGNGFRNWVTQDNIRDVGCSMRAFNRECVDNILAFKGMHRFLPTLVKINGYENIVEIPVKHRARFRGQTKYGISNRLFVGLKDSYAVKWMKSRLVKPEVRLISRQRGNK